MRKTKKPDAFLPRAGVAIPIVAIGASAGGLDALRAVLAKLPPDTGMAFVVIQHLDPVRKSALASLLSKATSLPVFEISRQIAVQPNHVYVVPYDKRAAIANGTLSAQPVTSRNRSHPIDDFMVALAAQLGDGVIGVVLSGMGSDGTGGLAAIRAAEGFTFAQDPKTAQWPGMPLSAIKAGYADFVLSPARIALELGRLGRHPYRPAMKRYTTKEFDEIFQILRTATGIDFRHYKQSSVVRRILRHMALQNIPTLAQYSRLLRRNRKDAEFLADQVFVPFTGFFRDEESFMALRKCIRPNLRPKPRSVPLRVWVAGCSTGEEVYSIAMLLAEEMGPLAGPSAIQVFGTDIRERAIQHARAGLYSKASVAGVTAARLKRFFSKSDGSYRINEDLRKLCVFARHDLTKDPPISNLDLISCRNVLSYFRSALQEQALAIFHYVLKPLALLFTDSSIAAKASSQFVLKDSKHGIFARRPDAHKSVRGARRPIMTGRTELGARIAVPTGRSVTRAALMATNEQLSAANEELETTNEELRASYQENIALGAELRTSNMALKALADDLGTLLTGVDIPVVVLDSRLRIVRFTPAAATLFHLAFSDEGASFLRAASNLEKLPWARLLADVTRRGQTVERAFQHRNSRWYSVRMKPFGESKNAISGVLVVLLDENEVRRSLVDTRGLLADSESTVRMLMDASPEAILAVEASGRIVWANNTAATMFGYDLPELLGQSMDILVPKSFRNRYRDQHRKFLAEGESRPAGVGLDLQALRKDGSQFPAEIVLGVTKTRTGKIAVAFVTDITERKKLDQAIRQRESELVALFDSSPDTYVRFNSNLRITHANAAFGKLTGIPAQEIAGKMCRDLPLPQTNVQMGERLMRVVFRTGGPQLAELSIPSVEGPTHHEVRFVPEWSPDGSVAAVLAIGRDITEAKRVERSLRENERDVEALLDNSPDVILRVDSKLRLLFVNSSWTRLTGIPREAALGKTAHELGAQQTIVRLQRRAVQQVLKTGGPVTVEFRYPSAGGPVNYEVRYIPEFEDGSVSSILLIGRDITVQKRLQELAVANARDIHALTASLMVAQEGERRRLARDIHDSLCQHLSFLAAEIGGVVLDLPASSPAKERLQASRERALSIAEEARNISRQLHPAILEDLGLAKALRSLCDDFSQREGIPVTFRISGGPPSSFPIDAASCVYRVAQEALNNVARHARAKHVAVLLSGRRDLRLSIRDNGIGFDPTAVRGAGGLGLVSMEERVRMVGGTLRVQSRPGHGASVDLALPLLRKTS
jgi:PAS domain S-box-containing protein